MITVFILIYWTAKNNYFKDCPEIIRIGNYGGRGMSGIIRNWIGNVWFPLSLVSWSKNVSLRFFSLRLAHLQCLLRNRLYSASDRIVWNRLSILVLAVLHEWNGQQRNDPLGSFAVSVVKDSQVVGHLPKKHSRVFWHFIKRGGMVKCQVTGSREFTSDLPQGGLEVPCLLICSESIVDRLQKLTE